MTMPPPALIAHTIAVASSGHHAPSAWAVVCDWAMATERPLICSKALWCTLVPGTDPPANAAEVLRAAALTMMTYETPAAEAILAHVVPQDPPV